jgi:hypothetical protein
VFRTYKIAEPIDLNRVHVDFETVWIADALIMVIAEYGGAVDVYAGLSWPNVREQVIQLVEVLDMPINLCVAYGMLIDCVCPEEDTDATEKN